jgi:hypothetical protein
MSDCLDARMDDVLLRFGQNIDVAIVEYFPLQDKCSFLFARNTLARLIVTIIS